VLPFRIDSLLGLPAESGSVLRLDPDTGTYFCEGIKIKDVFCEGIQIQVRFLRRDPNTGTFLVKGSTLRMGLCREDPGYGYGQPVTAQSIAQDPVENLSGGGYGPRPQPRLSQLLGSCGGLSSLD
jgi:hypothetical protein